MSFQLVVGDHSHPLPPLAVVYIRTPERFERGRGVVARGIPHAGIVPVGFSLRAQPTQLLQSTTCVGNVGNAAVVLSQSTEGPILPGELCQSLCHNVVRCSGLLAGSPFTPLILLLLVLQRRGGILSTRSVAASSLLSHALWPGTLARLGLTIGSDEACLRAVDGHEIQTQSPRRVNISLSGSYSIVHV